MGPTKLLLSKAYNLSSAPHDQIILRNQRMNGDLTVDPSFKIRHFIEPCLSYNV